MRRSWRIILNTVSNIALQFVNAGVLFFLMPLVLRYFGKELFGIHSYIAGIVLLCTFVSSAISVSLMKYIPESLSHGDEKMFSRHVSATAMFSFLTNSVSAILICAFPFYGFRVFGIPMHLREVAAQVFFVMGISTLLQCFLPVINGIYYGLELFVLRNGIQLIALLANVLAYFVVIARQGSLTQYVIISQLGAIISMVLAAALIFPRLPFRLRWNPVDWSFIRQTFSLNAFLISNQAADSLLYSADKMILQRIFGAVYVADYHVARKTHALIQSVISLPLLAIIPSVSHAYASGDDDYLKKMNHVGALLYCAVLVPPMVVLFCMYDSFILLWVGAGFDRAVLAGRLFVLTIIAVLPLKVFSHCLLANGRVKEIGIAKVSYAILNIPLSILMSLRFGFIGVVIPTVAYWLIVHPVVVIALAAQQRIARRIISNMAIVIVLLPVGWGLCGILCPSSPDSWLGFVLRAGMLYIAVFVLYCFVGCLPYCADIRSVCFARRRVGV